MKRRDFLKTMVAIPSVVAVPSLVNANGPGEIAVDMVKPGEDKTIIHGCGLEEGKTIQVSGSCDNDGLHKITKINESSFEAEVIDKSEYSVIVDCQNKTVEIISGEWQWNALSREVNRQCIEQGYPECFTSELKI